MAYVTVKCPKCGRGTVFSGRGLCRCGVYLIDHWAGMHKGAKALLRWGRETWVREESGWRMIAEAEQQTES